MFFARTYSWTRKATHIKEVDGKAMALPFSTEESLHLIHGLIFSTKVKKLEYITLH